MLRKKKYLIGGMILLLAIGAFIYNAFASHSLYYYTVSELKAQGDSVYDKEVRVNGKVVDGSIDSDSLNLITRFAVADEDEAETLSVIYQGVLPDAFKPGADVVVQGRYDPNGVFDASQVLAKCPTRYAPQSGD